MKRLKYLIMGLLVTFSGVSFAYTVSQKPSGFYVGAQAGYAYLHYPKSWLTDDPNFISVGSVDNKGFASRVHVGYDFNQYFAMEMGYIYLPRIKFNDITISGGSGINESFRQSVIDFLAKGTLPLNGGFDLYGKAGIASVNRDDLEATAGGVTVKSNVKDTKTVAALGVGMDYRLINNLVADLGYMHYFNSGDLEATDFIGLGIAYRF
jgi:opacity protein-like surface antigen